VTTKCGNNPHPPCPNPHPPCPTPQPSGHYESYNTESTVNTSIKGSGIQEELYLRAGIETFVGNFKHYKNKLNELKGLSIGAYGAMPILPNSFRDDNNAVPKYSVGVTARWTF
jgi:hypothetical protein